jgi:hypothetical protein
MLLFESNLRSLFLVCHIIGLIVLYLHYVLVFYDIHSSNFDCVTCQSSTTKTYVLVHAFNSVHMGAIEYWVLASVLMAHENRGRKDLYDHEIDTENSQDNSRFLVKYLSFAHNASLLFLGLDVHLINTVLRRTVICCVVYM